jgi:hypothetical protein
MELSVNRKTKFKDIQRFKEISEILNITFEEAGAFHTLLNKNNVEKNHAIVVEEIETDENESLLIAGGF